MKPKRWAAIGARQSRSFAIWRRRSGSVCRSAIACAFLRHVRAHWDIHRHRLPPELIQKIDTLRSAQRLTIHAGHIKEFIPRDDRIEAIWRPRGTQRQRRNSSIA